MNAPAPTDRSLTLRRLRRPTGPRSILAAAVGVVTLVGPAVAQELPVERITLYRSGVGSFERRGTVSGDADVQLSVDADLVNDILKSMVLLDLDGGRIESASYGSREPLERRLASFAVDLSDAPGRAELLQRLRGTMVRLVRVDGKQAEGRVLSVENVTIPVDEKPMSLPHVTLSTGGGMESHRLDQLQSFSVLDPEIRAEIDRALTAIAEQRTDRVKSLDLAFRGVGERNVIVSYVHEMPVWKTSYRLVLPDPEEGGGAPFMQGWAIVENTTDEDWRDVSLSLVAGRPVGFVMDLYEPLFLSRPEVPVPVEMAAAPRTYGGELQSFKSDARQDQDRVVSGRAMRAAPSAPPGAGGGGGRGSGFAGVAADTAVAEMGEAMNMYAMGSAAASGAGDGTVFRFELDEPVTIERRRSAMLPILSAGIEGRRVSILSNNTTHPMRGVELKNTTGLQMMPGPISVYDDGTYAGDAQIDFVPSGDERLLSYAVDLEVRSEFRDSTQSRVRSVRIVDGTIEETIGREYERSWTIRNADADEDRTIIVEAAAMNGWEIVSPEPSERAAGIDRFEVDVPAGKTVDLVVQYRRTDLTRMAATSYDLDRVLAHERSGAASKAVVDAIRRARQLQAAVAEAERELKALEDERSEITSDQSRIRENLARVGQNTELGGRYVRKLGEQEDRLEAIEAAVKASNDLINRRRADLQAYLRDLDVR
jgi:hypothetical protein